ncbi:MAG: hypothetical protein ACLQIJ_01240, partial [Polyangia bacterium]
SIRAYISCCSFFVCLWVFSSTPSAFAATYYIEEPGTYSTGTCHSGLPNLGPGLCDFFVPPI